MIKLNSNGHVFLLLLLFERKNKLERKESFSDENDLLLNKYLFGQFFFLF